MTLKSNFGLALLLSTTLAAPNAFARYDASDAKHDCKREVTHDYRYHNAHNVHVEKTDKGRFRVKGKVKSTADNKDHKFTCKVRHREVVSWNVNPHGIGGDSSDNDNTALAIGAGIVGLAALAAIASNDDEYSNSRNDYQNDRGDDPFDDINYLKKECNRTIWKHLNDDHSPVKSLHFNRVNLRHRELRGRGEVHFRDGEDRDLKFSCHFDRRGRVHDGDYHYSH